ncbi:MAG TPA: hypothetical protein VFQ20_09120 [Burkholderiaceae bacterium]|nr:hypothetical protein [Burkholderiaceae bacterium]
MVLRAWVLASALAPLFTAADEAPRGRPVSRDELRECMGRGDELAAHRRPLAAQRAEHERALAAQRAAGEALVREQAALDAVDARRVAEFDARPAAHNARGAELDARTERLRDEGRRFNAAMLDHNARCGGIVFRAEDRAAILQEREMQRKKAQAQ